jgi:hypothetical protein
MEGEKSGDRTEPCAYGEMERMHFVRKKRLVEWETIMAIVRKEVEPREYGGDLEGAMQVLAKLPQDDGFVLKKWGDVLFKEAQKSGSRETGEKALDKARSAEHAFPQARYKHEARKLQEQIRTWMETGAAVIAPSDAAAMKEREHHFD